MNAVTGEHGDTIRKTITLCSPEEYLKRTANERGTGKKSFFNSPSYSPSYGAFFDMEKRLR